MTCEHVLELVDAGHLAEYPRAHLDAAWHHARQCATCGPALDAATGLTRELEALIQPGPPPEFAATVLARLARTEPSQRSRPTIKKAASTATRMPHEWFASAAALGALAVVLAIVLPMLAGEEMRLGMMSPRVAAVSALLTMASTRAHSCSPPVSCSTLPDSSSTRLDSSPRSEDVHDGSPILPSSNQLPAALRALNLPPVAFS
jgi:hypothetical protein